jgi:hypothetical protein
VFICCDAGPVTHGCSQAKPAIFSGYLFIEETIKIEVALAMTARIMPILAVASMIGPSLAYGSPACMTESEARAKFPKAHLIWFGSNHCWTFGVAPAQSRRPVLAAEPVPSRRPVPSSRNIAKLPGQAQAEIADEFDRHPIKQTNGWTATEWLHPAIAHLSDLWPACRMFQATQIEEKAMANEVQNQPAMDGAAESQMPAQQE